jgi:hypothetical protein
VYSLIIVESIIFFHRPCLPRVLWHWTRRLLGTAPDIPPAARPTQSLLFAKSCQTTHVNRFHGYRFPAVPSHRNMTMQQMPRPCTMKRAKPWLVSTISFASLETEVTRMNKCLRQLYSSGTEEDFDTTLDDGQTGAELFGRKKLLFRLRYCVEKVVNE